MPSQNLGHLRVLVIEDTDADYELMVQNLRLAGYDVEADRASSHGELAPLLRKTYDIVLCDHGLPDTSVPDVIRELREHGNPAPVIVVTGQMDDQSAAMLMRAGAFDFLLKDRMARLADSVRHALREKDLAASQRAAELRAERVAGMAQMLRTIGTAISTSTDLKLTLGLLLGQAMALMDMDAAAVLLFSERSRMLEYAHGVGFSTDVVQRTRLRLGEGIAGRALAEMAIEKVRDISEEDSGFVRTQLAGGEEYRGYVAIPLASKGKPLGVLEVYSERRLRLTSESQEVMESLATAAAIAIENFQLLDAAVRQNMALERTYDLTLMGWARALELRDIETEGHSQRVTELTDIVATEYGLDAAEVGHLRRGALLHDIGKMGIQDSVLLKSEALSDAEWSVMRQHPEYGYWMLAGIEYLRPAAEIVRAHHEKWDGSGYPRGLHGEGIPLGARIFAVADVYDALRSTRPYKAPWDKDTAIEYIEKLAGIHFDQDVIVAFMRLDRSLLW